MLSRARDFGDRIGFAIGLDVYICMQLQYVSVIVWIRTDTVRDLWSVCRVLLAMIEYIERNLDYLRIDLLVKVLRLLFLGLEEMTIQVIIL